MPMIRESVLPRAHASDGLNIIIHLLGPPLDADMTERKFRRHNAGPAARQTASPT